MTTSSIIILGFKLQQKHPPLSWGLKQLEANQEVQAEQELTTRRSF